MANIEPMANTHVIERSFQDLCIFLVASSGPQLLGYGLVLLHSGTRLARLYSIAVAPAARGRGIAQRLITALEAAAEAEGRWSWC